MSELEAISKWNARKKSMILCAKQNIGKYGVSKRFHVDRMIHATFNDEERRFTFLHYKNGTGWKEIAL